MGSDSQRVVSSDLYRMARIGALHPDCYDIKQPANIRCVGSQCKPAIKLD